MSVHQGKYTGTSGGTKRYSQTHISSWERSKMVCMEVVRKRLKTTPGGTFCALEVVRKGELQRGTNVVVRGKV